MISPLTIQEVKDRANIVEVVSDVVQLKRQGVSYTGLCPFHNEKTSSFHVREHDGFYHCFGCGVSGSVIDFVMRMRGLSFPEAVEDLAGRYGIEVKREGLKKSDGAALRQPIYRANRLALEFFCKNLNQPEAQAYLKLRGLESACVEAFGIGFAPKSFNALSQALTQQKVSADTLLKSGLAKRSTKGELFDAMRGRLIFPIYEDARRILGFGGRILPALVEEKFKETTPKYLNSPESPVYHKSKVLYGFPQANASIRESSHVFLVEGYMDVVSLWQAGVQNVLATCGTAVTEDHVKRLGRLAQRVTVMFDADGAGRRAAGKAFHVFLNSGLDVSAIFLPEGQDPDSVAHTHGPQTANYLESLERQPLLKCFLNGLCEKFGSLDEIGAAAKGKLCEEVAQALLAVKNAVEQGALVERACAYLRVNVSELRSLMRGVKPKGIITPSAPSTAVTPPTGAAPKEIQNLPPIDRELLLTAMAEREHLLEAILNNADAVGSLDPCTLAFLQGLQAAVQNSEISEEERKEHIRALLAQFGHSWEKHWKKAYEMKQDKAVNLEKVYNECALTIRKTKLIHTLRELDRSIGEASNESEKLGLMNEKVMLSRRLGELTNAGP